MLAPGSPVNLNQAIIEPGGFKSRAHVSFDPVRVIRFAKVNEYEVPPALYFSGRRSIPLMKIGGEIIFFVLVRWRFAHFHQQFAAIPSAVRNYDHKKSLDQQGSFLT